MLPCVYHYALAEFEVFHKGFPKLQWFVFLWPRWRDFLEIEGQYHRHDPPPSWSSVPSRVEGGAIGL